MFVTDLYVYLIDHMQSAIEQVFGTEDKTISESKQENTKVVNVLKSFADLSEKEGNTESAKQYHLERIARYQDNNTVWFQYAAFCMRNQMYLTGEESFREILSRNAKHVPSLLAYGAICHMNNRSDEAHVCLNAAYKLQPTNPLVLAILGLFHFIMGDDDEGSSLINQGIDLFTNETGSEYCLIYIYLIT